MNRIIAGSVSAVAVAVSVAACSTNSSSSGPPTAASKSAASTPAAPASKPAASASATPATTTTAKPTAAASRLKSDGYTISAPATKVLAAQLKAEGVGGSAAIGTSSGNAQIVIVVLTPALAAKAASRERSVIKVPGIKVAHAGDTITVTGSKTAFASAKLT